MFLEHKEQGEVTEAPAKITKLSEAIRVGCKMRGEGRLLIAGPYDSPFCGTCAIGAALIATGYSGPSPDHDDAMDWLCPRVNVPRELIATVSAMHYKGERDRLGIADWLETQGL